MKAELKPLTKKDGTVSDKCFVLIGGKEIKDDLKAMKGKFSPFWNVGGTPTPGWMLPNTKREAVELLLSQYVVKVEQPTVEPIKVTTPSNKPVRVGFNTNPPKFN